MLPNATLSSISSSKKCSRRIDRNTARRLGVYQSSFLACEVFRLLNLEAVFSLNGSPSSRLKSYFLKPHYVTCYWLCFPKRRCLEKHLSSSDCSRIHARWLVDKDCRYGCLARHELQLDVETSTKLRLSRYCGAAIWERSEGSRRI